ncbi:hypothetical protein [Salinivibrio sp. VYel1]|uniref:hypothetical protein n=1 Tax=Salinivibrio sp. VYel1 TaxID=2490490 RepID=UPI00128BF62A|nr:hypothetical protein [Salinivibrio sp. VYel1]MPX91426.1 hypothetical protein [Salinivibrio sp. VYel1]
MHPFHSIKGNQIDFFTDSGEVIDSVKNERESFKSWVISNVLGSVMQLAGGASIPQLKPKSVQHHEFWLRRRDGTEAQIMLEGTDAPLIKGQEVTLLYAIRFETNHRELCTMINHNSRSWTHLMAPTKLLKRLGVTHEFNRASHGPWILTALVMVMALFSYTDWPMAIMLTLFLAGLAIIKQQNTIKENSARFDKHINEISRDLLEYS